MGFTTSKPRITAQDRAILELKLQRDKLKRYQKKLLLVIDREVSIAKEQLHSGNKRRALLALKKKKFQETLLEKTEAQLITLEGMTNMIEFALVEKDVLAGLKIGNDVLAVIHKETSIEAVEKLMDDTADAIAYQNEIDELLSGKITDSENAEILEELDAIEKAEADKAVAEMPEVPSAPFPVIKLPEGDLVRQELETSELVSETESAPATENASRRSVRTKEAVAV